MKYLGHLGLVIGPATALALAMVWPSTGATQVVKIPTSGSVDFNLKTASKGESHVTIEGPGAKYKYRITKKNGDVEEHEYSGSKNNNRR